MGLAATIQDATLFAGGHKPGDVTVRADGRQHLRKHNVSALVDPTVNDDATQGFEVGSTWINGDANRFFVNTRDAAGEARWLDLSAVSSPAGIEGSLQYKSGNVFAGGVGLTWNTGVLAVNDAVNGGQLTLSRGASLNLQRVGNHGAPTIVGNTGGGSGVFRVVASGGGTGGLDLNSGTLFTVQTNSAPRLTIGSTGAATFNATTGSPLTVQTSGNSVFELTSAGQSAFRPRTQWGAVDIFADRWSSPDNADLNVNLRVTQTGTNLVSVGLNFFNYYSAALSEKTSPRTDI